MKQERLLSLDVMRGMTIAAMILVNNPAVWGKAYAPLQHAFWHGMTPTDLIYPFFVFIMGVSAWFSLSSRCKGPDSGVSRHIVRRSAVIFALGLLLQEISYFGYGTANYLSGAVAEGTTWAEAVFPWRTFRILGVLQGLALAYLLGALLLVRLRFRHMTLAAAVLLLVYLAVLQWGNGYALSADNIIARVDRAVLGEAHLYREWLPDGSRLAFEPEGLLSTLPRVAQFLLGCAAGRLLRLDPALCRAVAAVRRSAQQEDLEQLLRVDHVGICLTAPGRAVLGNRLAEENTLDGIFQGLRGQPALPLHGRLDTLGYPGCLFGQTMVLRDADRPLVGRCLGIAGLFAVLRAACLGARSRAVSSENICQNLNLS